MKPRNLELYRRMLSAYAEIYDGMVEIAEDSKNHERRKTELADTAFAMREIADLADQIRKRAKAIQELSENIACALAIRDSDTGAIRTEYVTASPNLKTKASVPNVRNDFDRYKLFMTHLGVPEELWNRPQRDEDIEDRKEVVRLHWPGVVQYLSELAVEGKPVPPGMKTDKTYAAYSLRMRRNKDLA